MLVTEIVRDSDMVFGVWRAEEEPNGFAVQITKGEAMMPPCECFERDIPRVDFRLAASSPKLRQGQRQQSCRSKSVDLSS